MIKKLICFLALTTLNPLFASPLPDKPHIYVEGSSVIEIEPDTADFTLYLEDINPDVEIAKNTVDKRSVELLELCKELGIDEHNVSATGLNVSEHNTYDRIKQKNVFIGVRVTRSVTVTLENVERFRDIQHELINSKLSPNVGVRLYINDERPIQNEAQRLALEDATTRAKNLAKLQGKKLAGVYSISEFNLRKQERYNLTPSRNINSGSVSSTISVRGASGSHDQNIADALSRVTGVTLDPFDSGKMRATATIYVVFLIK